MMVLAVWGLIIPLHAHAGDERIADLVVIPETNRRLSISARLVRWMNPELKEDIHNGIPKDLFYTIVLNKRFSLWFDEEMDSKTIKHTIKYDILKEQYLISTWEGGSKQERIADTSEEMMELISNLNNVKMITDRSLKTRHTYYIRIKAEVKTSRLPFYLDYILFFIPVPEMDTPWADSAPFYALAATP